MSFCRQARCAACCRIEASDTPSYPDHGITRSRRTPLMPIRDILLPMLSYPVATAVNSIERAATLAAGSAPTSRA
jgi:hypothetical protein